MGFIELNLIDREQRHSQITYFFEQAMQRRLIRNGSRKKRVSVFKRDGHTFEPVCPLRGQVACNPDFIEGRMRFHVQRQYTGREVLPGSNLSID